MSWSHKKVTGQRQGGGRGKNGDPGYATLSKFIHSPPLFTACRSCFAYIGSAQHRFLQRFALNRKTINGIGRAETMIEMFRAFSCRSFLFNDL